ncbi:MAG TPA: AAA family ATPase, partial [Planctomycetaceae bacterium]
MLALDFSYLTPTRVDETGIFEILDDRGRQLRYDTPRVRFINPPPFEPVPTIEWLWTDRIPQGRVTVIEGPAGAGKTFLTSHLTA